VLLEVPEAVEEDPWSPDCSPDEAWSAADCCADAEEFWVPGKELDLEP